MNAPGNRGPSSPLGYEPRERSEQEGVLARFRERLAVGDYHGVVGRGLRRTLRGAAADTGLELEVGALRLTLIRLLNEEHDPSRLATGVSRVAGVAVQAARLRLSPDADLDEIRTLLLRELEAFEREYVRDATQRKEMQPNDED